MSIQYSGQQTFFQSAPERWSINSEGLDSVTIPYSGAAGYLNAFLQAHPKWASCPLDGNLYLSDVSNNDDRHYPTVELRYIGFKFGVLPAPINSSGHLVQQVSFTSFSGDTTIALTYISPTSSKRIFSNVSVDVGTIGAIAPANVTAVWFVSHSKDGEYNVNDGNVLSFFYQREAVTGQSEEIVPGRYFSGVQTRTNLLFSSQA